MRRPIVVGLLAATLILVVAADLGRAAAQGPDPSAPIKDCPCLIRPGGSSDVLMRVIAERMRQSLAQPIIVEKRVGRLRQHRRWPRRFGQRPTATRSCRATGPLTSPTALSIRCSTICSRDFAPVGLIVSNPVLIAAKKGVPADTLKDLIAWLKADPGKASQGDQWLRQRHASCGCLLPKRTPARRFTFVPYRGGSATMNDLLAGNIDSVPGPRFGGDL